MNDEETCTRCGQTRLPASWYGRGWEWVGHGITPCIGAARGVV